jgi:hypothetical protein
MVCVDMNLDPTFGPATAPEAAPGAVEAPAGAVAAAAAPSSDASLQAADVPISRKIANLASAFLVGRRLQSGGVSCPLDNPHGRPQSTNISGAVLISMRLHLQLFAGVSHVYCHPIPGEAKI